MKSRGHILLPVTVHCRKEPLAEVLIPVGWELCILIVVLIRFIPGKFPHRERYDFFSLFLRIRCRGVDDFPEHLVFALLHAFDFSLEEGFPPCSVVWRAREHGQIERDREGREVQRCELCCVGGSCREELHYAGLRRLVCYVLWLSEPVVD